MCRAALDARSDTHRAAGTGARRGTNTNQIPTWSPISPLFRDRESIAVCASLCRSQTCTPAQKSSFSKVGLMLQSLCLALGAAPVNSSTGGAALASGASAESGCAAAPPRSSASAGRGGKVHFLLFNAAASGGAAVEAALCAGHGHSERAPRGLSAPTRDLTLSAS